MQRPVLHMAPAGVLFSSFIKNETKSSVEASYAFLLLEPLFTAPQKLMTPSLTCKQLQQLTQELLFNGRNSAQQLCIDQGLPLQSVQFGELEQALVYGDRHHIQAALHDLAAQEQCIAALDKVVGKAVSQLNEAGGAYVHGQAARLLEVAAAFATSLLGRHAMAAWLGKERCVPVSHPSPQQGRPGGQLRASSAEVANLCHHLETIRRLQEVVGRRLASDYSRQSQATEADARPTAASDPLALTLRQEGRSGRRLRVMGLPGFKPNSWEGGLTPGVLDWSLPGERALIVKQGQAGHGGKQTAALGDLVATGTHAIERTDGVDDERPEDMVARWGREECPMEVVVRDALRAGRLALAVAYLQRKREADSTGGHVFEELREAGRRLAFAYFRAGNIDTALLALRRLGEDTEQALRELAMGSLDRDIRNQAAAELQTLGRLGKHDARALRILGDLEAAYPQASFWQAYQARAGHAAASDAEIRGNGIGLRVPVSDNLRGASTTLVDVSCGEASGAVLGCWGAFAAADTQVAQGTEYTGAGQAGDPWYLCLAADWVSRWDRLTIERIYLERGLPPPTPVSWQARLLYHVAHHDWPSVEPLLENVPEDCLKEGALRVKRADTTGAIGASHHPNIPAEDEEEVYVPGVKLLLVNVTPLCTELMRGLVEEKLARQHVFLQAEWDGTVPLLRLLARANLLFAPAPAVDRDLGRRSFTPEGQENGQEKQMDGAPSGRGSEERREGAVYVVHDPPGLRLTAVAGAHAVVVRHCVEQGLPHLLQTYLDWHGVGRDPAEVEPLQLAAGRCEWAHWLLLSRLPGEEFAASFSNARAMSPPDSAAMAHGAAPFPSTLDEMAQGRHELRALATLIHAPVPLEECLDGSASAPDDAAKGPPQDLPSWYCRLGSLTCGLHDFPTLCQMLERASGIAGQPKLEDAPGLQGFWRTARLDGVLEPYVRWRHSLLASAARDTSLLSMLPPSTPPAVRQVVQASMLGVATLSTSAEPSSDEDRLCEWEAATEEVVERQVGQHRQEQQRGVRVEHLLKKGRPLAALDCLLTHREDDAAQQSLPAKTCLGPGPVSGHHNGRRNRGSRASAGDGVDPQKGRLRSRRHNSDGREVGDSETRNDGWKGRLRDPLTDEEFTSILKQTVPLAVKAFDDRRVTSACCAFLELCGVPAGELRVDLAALQRVQEAEVGPQTEASGHSPSADLASALSDAYAGSIEESVLGPLREVPKPQASCAAVEAVTLNTLADSGRPSSPEKKRWGRAHAGGKERGSAGNWLRKGQGENGRTDQMEASEKWELVTAFCTAHGLPPSEAYLQQLAQNDDWLGFLAEAQKEGTPLQRLVAITAAAFSDPALREHVLIVLRSLRADLGPDSAVTESESDQGTATPELFGILADCEKQSKPGAALLEKARDLRWPLLAVVASSYDGGDVLPCLETWLAATAPGVGARRSKEAAALAQAVDGAVRKLNLAGESLRRAESEDENEKDRRAQKRRCTVLSQEEGTLAEGEQLGPEVASTEATGLGLESDAVVDLVGRMCGEALFLPLLRGLEIFTPASSLIHFVRGLLAATRFDREGAVAHFQHFGRGVKDNGEEAEGLPRQLAARAAVAAADAVLGTSPTEFERKWLLAILEEVQEWGSAATDGARYRLWSLAFRLCPALPLDPSCTSEALLDALAADGKWDEARDIAHQFDRSRHHISAQESQATAQGTALCGEPTNKDAQASGRLVDRLTLRQAEALLGEWRELLWDDPAERFAIWGHCSALFEQHSLPAGQAGRFFLRHAEELTAGNSFVELHTALLLCVQWLSGLFSATGSVASAEDLGALEAEVWKAAIRADQAAGVVAGGPGVAVEPDADRGGTQGALRATAELWPAIVASQGKRNRVPSHRARKASAGAGTEAGEAASDSPTGVGRYCLEPTLLSQGCSDAEVAAAVSALLEDGRVGAARKLLRHLHLIPPNNFHLVQAAEGVAAEGAAALPPQLATLLHGRGLHLPLPGARPKQAISTERSLILRDLAELCPVDEGRGHILRLGAVCQAAAVLSLDYPHAATSTPLELLQLLALQAGRPGALGAAEQVGLAYEGRKELPPGKVARVLAECFQKGLLAAHKGGYLGDGQAEEAGPAPLLWKSEDFMQWAAVCPDAPQVGHALMRLVIGGKSDLPPPCEAELLILAHRFYTSSACFDGLDVLAALAANRATAYLAEDNAAPVARLLVGTEDFVRLRSLADALVEDGHLDLLLTKIASHTALNGPLAAPSTARAVLLASLARQRSDDGDTEYQDAMAEVNETLGALYESASSLERRAKAGVKRAAAQRDSSPTALGRLTPTQPGSDKEMLKAMELYVEAAEKWGQLEAGSAAARCAHQAALVAVQLRLPDVRWLDLSPDSARRLFVEQPGGFEEALALAQAYELMDPLEWARAVWNQVMWQPLTATERYLDDFASTLPLAPPLLMELARAYRAEVTARDEDMSRWLPSGAGGAESGRHLGKAFKALLHHVVDYKLRLQLATLATGFSDVVNEAIRMLDKVPETAGPLIVRKGHGGTYVPLM